MARKTWVAGLLLALSLLIAPLRASAAPELFESIASLVPKQYRDSVEMARFSIDRPSEAANIYAHAAAQDYPFFALIGAAKAARDKNFPKLGTFTLAACRFPITAIDEVFSKASSKISNPTGKANTNNVTAAAGALAQQYAETTLDSAKGELVAQLAANVPYFSDIDTICYFAFETNLSLEVDIQNAISGTAQTIEQAYSAFASGDVVTGTARLASLGVNGAAICTLVDTAVTGGLISRTPLLGDLAKGACTGFTGAVLDGITGSVKGGVGMLEAGAAAGVNAIKNGFCKVYSLISSGCSDADPPPPAPTVTSNATGYCLAHGGVQTLSGGQVDNFSLRCNDGTECSQKPGTKPKCATAAEIAARHAQELAIAEAEYQQGTAAWQKSFQDRWVHLCPDKGCKDGLFVVTLNGISALKAAHEANPTARFATISAVPLANAQKYAVKVIEERRYLVLPPRWSALFKKTWQAKCWDKQCRDAIYLIAFTTEGFAQAKAKQDPRPMYSTMTTAYAESVPKAELAVNESLKRKSGVFAGIMAQEAAKWRANLIAQYGAKCPVPACVTEIEQLAAKVEALMNQVQADNPQSPSIVLIDQVMKEYRPEFDLAISRYARRAAPPVDRRARPSPGPIVRPMPGPTPRRPSPIVITPAPAPAPRRIIVQPAPAPTPAPVVRRVIRPTPTPTPTPTPKSGGRPPPRP